MLKTVDLAMQVLLMFTHQKNKWTGKELASAMGENYSTIYRILKTLQNRDFLTYNALSKEYALGISLWQLGQVKYESLNLEELVRPALVKLSRETGESIFFTVRRGMKGVTLLAEEPSFKVKFDAEVGASVPLYPGASYRSILAYQPEEFVDQLIAEGLQQFTPRTMTDPKVLKNELEKIRLDGYAMSEGEYTADVIALAVPIRDYENKVNCSVTLSGPTYRLQQVDLKRSVILLKETALEIEKTLRSISYKF